MLLFTKFIADVFFRKLDTNVRRKQVRLLDHVTDDADQSEQTNVSGHVLGTTIANSSVNQWLPSPQNRLTAGFIPPTKISNSALLDSFSVEIPGLFESTVTSYEVTGAGLENLRLQ